MTVADFAVLAVITAVPFTVRWFSQRRSRKRNAKCGGCCSCDRCDRCDPCDPCDGCDLCSSCKAGRVHAEVKKEENAR